MNQPIKPSEFIKIAVNSPNKEFLGVIGNPISHSKSPQLHNLAYEIENKTAQYFAIEITDLTTLKHFFEETEKITNCKGFNITIPYKTDSFLLYPNRKYNDIKAVNTMYKREGKWDSENTDWLGFIAPVKSRTINSALLLGWGGAASAVYLGLKNLNPNIKITVFSRRDIPSGFSSTKFVKGNYDHFPYSESHFDLIVNTTPLGMSSSPSDFSSEFLLSLTTPKIAYDLIYNPEITTFLGHFKSLNADTYNGLPMFLEQASHAHKIWFGNSFSKEVISKFMEIRS